MTADVLPDVTPSNVPSIVRWGWYSIGVNVALIAVHGAVAAASGSLAVTAELIHNFADFVAAAGVLIGLKLATRKSKSFPYGLYKIENLVAAAIAVMVFVTAYQIVASAFFEAPPTLHVDLWMLASLAATLALPLAFSHFELRAARAANSPALIADAREYRVHVYTTGIALAALLSGWFGFPVDRVAAAIIVLAVAKTGWDLLADALRVLLDASLDADSLNAVRKVIDGDPAVAEVKWVTGRNAGRFRFVEAGVALRLSDLAKAEVGLRRIEASVRAALPRVERVLLHIESQASPYIRYAVPLVDISGTISEHFGEAPYFAFVTVARSDESVAEQTVRPNPYHALERAKGIRVAEWLAAEKVDVVLARPQLAGKGPDYVLRDAGIEVRGVQARTLGEAFPRRPGEGARRIRENI